MKWPLLTGFCGGLVIFASCADLGYYAASKTTYRWRKPSSFESLRKQNEQLGSDLLTLQEVGFSRFSEDAPSALQKNADYLKTARGSKRPELRPVLDLQIATDYVEMARLERQTDNTGAADNHQQMAEGILHSLGWQDVSRETLAKLTQNQIWWERTK